MNVKKICKKCGCCCKGEIGPFVFPSDVTRICNFLDIEPFLFLSEYCTKHVIKSNTQDLYIYSINCNSNGCIFLKNQLCQIYSHRPFQCSHAPFYFLGDYSIWEHMPCVNEKDFKNINTIENDEKMFEQIIKIGYDKFLERRD